MNTAHFSLGFVAYTHFVQYVVSLNTCAKNNTLVSYSSMCTKHKTCARTDSAPLASVLSYTLHYWFEIVYRNDIILQALITEDRIL